MLSGLTVNWIPFASGGDMAQAMESGDIDISYSQGSPRSRTS